MMSTIMMHQSPHVYNGIQIHISLLVESELVTQSWSQSESAILAVVGVDKMLPTWRREHGQVKVRKTQRGGMS